MPMSLKRAVELLEAAGEVVPEEYKHYVIGADRQKRGVEQVWRCLDKNCGKEYESFVRIVHTSCVCGRQMRKVWPKD